MVHALDEVLMFIVSTDLLLSQGIGLDDAKALFDTKGGCASFQQPNVIKAQAGESVIVPTGQIPLVVYAVLDTLAKNKSAHVAPGRLEVRSMSSRT